MCRQLLCQALVRNFRRWAERARFAFFKIKFRGLECRSRGGCRTRGEGDAKLEFSVGGVSQKRASPVETSKGGGTPAPFSVFSLLRSVEKAVNSWLS